MDADSTLIYPSPAVEELLLPADKSNVTGKSATNDKAMNLSLPWAMSMPDVSHPVANYYTEINWGDGYEQWPLCRFATPVDGNCLFHAIANSFFKPYHEELLNGRSVTRAQIVSTLRHELSRRLGEVDLSDPEGRTYYACLSNGNTSKFADAVPEFKLKMMQDQLASNAPIGYGYMEFISNALNKDIYILEAARSDIYVNDELTFCIKGNRKSIVIYYMNGHYELVGIRAPDGSFDTYFEPNHSFIRFLDNIVKEVSTPST
jgi:hypothetical protein